MTLETQSRSAYRAHLRSLSREPLFLDVVTGQVSSWLRERKEVDALLDSDLDWEGDYRHVTARHVDNDGTRLFSLHMRESNTPQGDWITDILASSAGWVDVIVTSSEGRFVAVPAVVRYLMQVLRLGDGAAPYRDEVEFCDVDDVPDVLRELENPDRQGLIFLAGTTFDTPATDGLLDAFSNELETWARQTYGLARFVRLTPEATKAFADVSATHHVAPMTVRTYHPGVVLGDRTDALRHKWRSPHSLTLSTSASITDFFGKLARMQAATRRVPKYLEAARRAVEQSEQEALFRPQPLLATSPDALTEPTATPPTTPSDPEPQARPVRHLEAHAFVDRACTLFGIQPTVEALEAFAEAYRHLVPREQLDRIRGEMEAQQARVYALEDERARQDELLQTDELDFAIQAEELERTQGETRWLRGRLQELGAWDVAHATAPQADGDRPDSFEDLLTKLSELGGAVAFTGDSDVAIDLDTHDTLQAAVRTAWDACRCLADYTKAKASGLFTGGMKQYLDSPPPGYFALSSGKHAPTETTATMQAFGHLRRFPVPSSVDPSGRAEMVSHFKLARIGMVSPRLYYLDRSSIDGKVLIGYMGPHLPNTQTN